MYYHEVLIADSQYHSKAPLTYSFERKLPANSVVSVRLKNRLVTGFVTTHVSKPNFSVKPIQALLSGQPLPAHAFKLAEWLSDYYACELSAVLRQFAPSSLTTGQLDELAELPAIQTDIDLDSPLTAEQKKAINFIDNYKGTTVLLHGETASGKTRVYLELVKTSLKRGKSSIILTPEIALTTQLERAAKQKIKADIYVLHSQLTPSSRRKIWFSILTANRPVLIIGPRSALFAPVADLGLVVVDEAHEPAYKQEQTPRYHAVRTASQLGIISGAKVILGTATPAISDYYLASQKSAIATMQGAAKTSQKNLPILVVDSRDKANFSRNSYISNKLIDEISTTLSLGKQSLIFYNRRGSARLILCHHCGWQDICPNCDVPLIYHGDLHKVQCHICGFKKNPPTVCPSCGRSDVIYRGIGTKTLAEIVQKLFPAARIARFDSDSPSGQRLNEIYDELAAGKIDILIGTQQVAKGLDLPNLARVGILGAETAFTLPDYTSEERAFQLLYQVAGRVGRGHGDGMVIVQAYTPDNPAIKQAINRDYLTFYNHMLRERKAYNWPPFCYLAKLVCRRASPAGAERAAISLKASLAAQGLPVQIIGPTPAFYARRGKYYYWQLVIKAKQRSHLTQLAKSVPAGWSIDLDPIDLL
ncbi:MAG TPA: primosomal protein N' [Candidatus Saccharimonadales bacterium]|nr:primosomal protein N' [Candidatus Saccharimonadales bacterium]